MDRDLALSRRQQVEEFQRRHRSQLVTMFFSDIVDSTRFKQTLGDAEAVRFIQQHHAIIREILATFDQGEEIGTAGDSFFIVFAKPSDAVRFALSVQSRLRGFAVETGCALFDRIGIHVGEVWVEAHEDSGERKDLFGIQVDTSARVTSLGCADQILMTRFAYDSARQVLKGSGIAGLAPLAWLSHGLYSMDGVEEPLEIFEVGEEGQAALAPPQDSAKARRVTVRAPAPELNLAPPGGGDAAPISAPADTPSKVRGEFGLKVRGCSFQLAFALGLLICAGAFYAYSPDRWWGDERYAMRKESDRINQGMLAMPPPTPASHFYEDPPPNWVGLDANWPTYAAGEAPAATSLTVADAVASTENRSFKRPAYLRGKFRVTATGDHSAVLRTDPLPPRETENVRILVRYPWTLQVPAEGTLIEADSSRPMEIESIRHGKKGGVEILTREISNR